jgi:hypothetical protein
MVVRMSYTMGFAKAQRILQTLESYIFEGRFMSLRSPTEDENGAYGARMSCRAAAKHLVFLSVTKARFFACGSE